MTENIVTEATHVAPDPELVERPVRRRYSATYKLDILRQADRLERPGEIGERAR